MNRDEMDEMDEMEVDSSFDLYDEPAKYVTTVKPRRNYWGNLLDNDTYNEDAGICDDYDYYYNDDFE